MVPSTTRRAPTTRGSSIDHVGFDVENLEAFVRTLEARGITLEGRVQQVPGTRAKSVLLTDPWGTRIDLTEGVAPR